MSNLNWIDYIFLAIFLFSIMTGFMRGFVREIVSLMALVAGFVVATMFAQTLAATFTNAPAVQSVVNNASTAIGMDTAQPVSYIALGLSFALLFAGTVLVGSLLGYLLNAAFQTGVLGLGNRFLGGLFGFVRGYIINLVLIFVIQLSPVSEEVWWQQSRLVNAYQPAVQWLGAIVSPALANLKEKMGGTLQNVNEQLKSITNSVGSFAR